VAGRHRRFRCKPQLRLKKSLQKVGDKFVEVDWDTALNEIAAKLKEVVERYGPESVVTTRHDVHSCFLPLFQYLVGTPNLIGHERASFVGNVEYEHGEV
jgi:anaerobic selenocysteine-containing dehydrogenase